MSDAELAGGFAVPPTATLSGHLQDHYLRRVRALPEPTQRLMLLAAADPTGDATLVWRAGRTLGIGRRRRRPAASEQLLEIGAQVRFRHPLVRSAAYAAGSPQDRRAAHRALAEATDPDADPERRVWHLAAAATGPDEDVAAELERTADRAQARAGLAGRGGVPPAVGGPDRRPATTRGPRLGRRAAPTCTPARSTPRSVCWPRPKPPPSTISSGPAWSSCGDRSTGPPAPGGRRRSGCCRRPSGSSRSISGSRGTPTLTPVRIPRRRSSGTARRPAARGRQGGTSVAQPGHAVRCPVTCCSTAWRSMIIDGRAAAEPTLRRAVDAFLGDQVSADDWLQWGLLALRQRPSRSGTSTAGPS